jgi:hypothetical protein
MPNDLFLDAYREHVLVDIFEATQEANLSPGAGAMKEIFFPGPPSKNLAGDFLEYRERGSALASFTGQS